ncbi:hypothetical protein SAMN05443144_103147 [Fodinibius roseus]|uniref:Uncharacterized protein n=1 Tax=Fodinibius roseus TaxID=1194090 RepID=A0A1M4W7V0_9BACT|nr:hypothetical protein [Fodinibius roseus]SHE77277.1 hypothetical protein SAMN05443144_103147 [Fodinibius roseus]
MIETLCKKRAETALSKQDQSPNGERIFYRSRLPWRQEPAF